MYLSRLDILGFKSFQQKTTVTFNKGITAIVGPNGCGKTNIVDAIRWSLGEQKSSVLRSDKMENVIFNGTSKKKPMGMAEVSLTIQNDKGILPTEYSEVIITRRVFRSGESEYLLNKNIARLKDITSLFMDTGMGANAYSVIELKMVESILSPRAEDRRMLFEEAAGVNKYKLRRKMTIKKLEEVKNDLDRVNDIVAEVEKKVVSLEKQAKRAEKSKLLSDRLKGLELEFATREFYALTNRLLELSSKLESIAQRRKEINLQISNLENSIIATKQELNAVEIHLKEKRLKLHQITEQIYKFQRAISVAEETLRALNNNIVKYSAESEELSEQLFITEDKLAEHYEKVDSIKIHIAFLENEKIKLQSSLAETKKSVEEKKSSFKIVSEENLQKFKNLTIKQNELSSLSNSYKTLIQSIQKHQDRMVRCGAEISKSSDIITNLSNERIEATERLNFAEQQFDNEQRLKESLEQQLNSLRENEYEEKTALSEIRNRMNFLTKLIENLEGFSKGTKSLFDSELWENRDKKLLANTGETTEKYKFAIESALKNNLNNILLKSFSEVEEAVNYLQNKNSGKASFLIYGNLPGEYNSYSKKIIGFLTNRKILKLEKEKGFIGRAADLIETEQIWQPFFNKILQGTIIVEDLESAISLQDKYFQFTFVTLSGDILYPTGVIEAGATPIPDETVFGRRLLLEKAEREFTEREIVVESITANISKIITKISIIDLRMLSENVKILINDLSSVDKQISQIEFEKSKLISELEDIKIDIVGFNEKSESISSQITNLENNVTAMVNEKVEADKLLFDLEIEVKTGEENFSVTRTAYNSAEINLTRALGEKRNLENSVKNAIDTIENIKKSIARRQKDIHTSEGEIKYLIEKLEDDKFELQELKDVKNSLSLEEKEIETKFNEIRILIAQLENENNIFRKEKEGISTEMHKIDLEKNEIEINKRNLIQKIEERYSLLLEFVEVEPDEKYDSVSRKSEIRNLDQQIHTLGPVNALAFEEYEEEKGRFEFLTAQKKDLIASQLDLIKTMEEINITAQNKFNETFEKIRTYFTGIFQNLFNPGDEADLRLEENSDPLEAKIEIIAKPKGKRPTSIELLSGGEKTLTAIALLFAIYLVKPSPFCILDEIDAPLDDANIDRFTNILREFSTKTQFIVVTHNKRTMEAADILYGVTMQEEGVSKLVGVKFHENVSLADVK